MSFTIEYLGRKRISISWLLKALTLSSSISLPMAWSVLICSDGCQNVKEAFDEDFASFNSREAMGSR